MRNVLLRGLLPAMAAAATLATPAMAANQGSLGTTSTGDITIRAQVPAHVRISGLADVTFNPADPTTAASNTQTVCVFSNTATRGYTIRANGDGTGSDYTLASTAGTVPYSVQWQDAVATTASSMAPTVVTTGQRATNDNVNCSNGGENASLTIGITAANLQTMQAGLMYTGVLELRVAPE